MSSLDQLSSISVPCKTHVDSTHNRKKATNTPRMSCLASNLISEVIPAVSMHSIRELAESALRATKQMYDYLKIPAHSTSDWDTCDGKRKIGIYYTSTKDNPNGVTAEKKIFSSCQKTSHLDGIPIPQEPMDGRLAFGDLQ